MSEESEFGYFTDAQSHMHNWDSWMKYIQGGGRGDFPRLGYESIIEAGQSLEAEILSLRSQVEVLRAALKPLNAWGCAVLKEYADHDDDIVAAGYGGFNVRFVDLRRARAALAEESK